MVPGSEFWGNGTLGKFTSLIPVSTLPFVKWKPSTDMSLQGVSLKETVDAKGP